MAKWSTVNSFKEKERDFSLNNNIEKIPNRLQKKIGNKYLRSTHGCREYHVSMFKN